MCTVTNLCVDIERNRAIYYIHSGFTVFFRVKHHKKAEEKNIIVHCEFHWSNYQICSFRKKKEVSRRYVNYNTRTKNVDKSRNVIEDDVEIPFKTTVNDFQKRCADLFLWKKKSIYCNNISYRLSSQNHFERKRSWKNVIR